MSLTNKEIRRAIKKMRISNGDIILLKQGANLATNESIKQMSVLLDTAGHKDIVIVVVDSFDDLKALPEREMAKYGWLRRERLQSLLVRKPAKQPTPEPEEHYEVGN